MLACDLPDAPGLLGPFTDDDRRAPHVYARNIHCGAGDCVCGAPVGDPLHAWIAPGLPTDAVRGLAIADIRKCIDPEPRPMPPDLQRGVVRQLLPVAKSGEEKRFLLGLAYVAGRDPRIRKGQDGGRDFFEPEELEKCCWSFLPGGGQVGIAHLDGTLGHMTVTENYIYRGPDWEQPSGLVLKSGMAWLIGGICDPFAWGLAKSGQVNGFSMQGEAKRRARQAA